MPQLPEYHGMTLSDAVRHLAAHHHARDNRHISHAEHDLLQSAADALDVLEPVADLRDERARQSTSET